MTVSVQGSSQVWSYPNLHGDNIITADGTGVRSGTLAAYDPFGDPVDPTTNRIGTTSADDALPVNTSQPTASYGWEGQAQKLTEHFGDIATIEMGAREYVPILGRFLSVDPVAGGNANDFTYPNDPIDKFDLTGMWGWDDTFGVAMVVLTVLDFVPGLDVGSVALQGVLVGARALSLVSKAAKALRAADEVSEIVPSAARAAKMLDRATPTGSALKNDLFHAAGRSPVVRSRIAAEGRVSQWSQVSDRSQVTAIRMEGAVTSASGTTRLGQFEWFLRNGELVHQFFRPF